MLRLVNTQRAMKAHGRALDEMQMQYQHPGDTEETNFKQLMEAATAKHMEEEWATSVFAILNRAVAFLKTFC
jgi:hypothetical protein